MHLLQSYREQICTTITTWAAITGSWGTSCTPLQYLVPSPTSSAQLVTWQVSVSRWITAPQERKESTLWQEPSVVLHCGRLLTTFNIHLVYFGHQWITPHEAPNRATSCFSVKNKISLGWDLLQLKWWKRKHKKLFLWLLLSGFLEAENIFCHTG